MLPITLWNHAPADGIAGCGDPPARALAGSLQPDTGAARQLAEVETLRAVTPKGLLRPFVHLLDGGLSDNVDARGPTDDIAQFGGVIAGTRAAGYRGVRRVAFVIINAETSARAPNDNLADVPGLLRTALALADIPINRNSNTASRPSAACSTAGGPKSQPPTREAISRSSPPTRVSP